MSRVKEMEKQLREWRKDHPKTDLGLSFVPYVGTALAAQDFAEKPTALGAAGLALSPVAKMAKMLRGSKIAGNAMDVYHGSPHKWDKWNWLKLGKGHSGAYAGPGVNAASTANRALDWSMQATEDVANKKRYIYTLDVPDEEITKLDTPKWDFSDKSYGQGYDIKGMIKMLREARKEGLKTLDTPIPSPYSGVSSERQFLIVDPRNVKIKDVREIDLDKMRKARNTRKVKNEWLDYAMRNTDVPKYKNKVAFPNRYENPDYIPESFLSKK